MQKSQKLGTEKIGKLLASQAIPAAIGFMLMSFNMIVDTFFVGQYIGKLAIGAVGIVTPIAFLMSSVGMAIGVGGSSIVSRALGAKEHEKVQLAFNNQVSLSIVVSVLFSLIGYLFMDDILTAFGALGDLKTDSVTYYSRLLIGIPFLSLAMMANNNLRAEGKPQMAMLVLLVPSIFNMLLDYIFILLLDYGMEGAAWATSISYISSFVGVAYYYIAGKGELKINLSLFKPDLKILSEIFSIGSVSVVRQGAISLLTIIINKKLFYYGMQAGINGEDAITVYTIVNRIAMFAFFPLIGIAQGFVPIVGYNYGAQQYDRVKETIRIALLYGFFISVLLCGVLIIGSDYIPSLFNDDPEIIQHTPSAIFWIFLATPVVIFQLIGASYFQALGNGKMALVLTLSKQLFFLIPLLYIVPPFFGLKGIWYAFPIADILSAILCFIFLYQGIKILASKK
ncbi:MAG: MATE family efflux transporter [Flavobacteriales bacterium]|jgi:putative MATE family efflux protein|nr:MATE family efflux transporter [Flavobacteriales bacterium]